MFHEVGKRVEQPLTYKETCAEITYYGHHHDDEQEPDPTRHYRHEVINTGKHRIQYIGSNGYRTQQQEPLQE